MKYKTQIIYISTLYYICWPLWRILQETGTVIPIAQLFLYPSQSKLISNHFFPRLFMAATTNLNQGLLNKIEEMIRCWPWHLTMLFLGVIIHFFWQLPKRKKGPILKSWNLAKLLRIKIPEFLVSSIKPLCVCRSVRITCYTSYKN